MTKQRTALLFQMKTAQVNAIMIRVIR
uniref:Uncharacterized protein n=1 Tax=Arundo donax TaxID=35708 RepID=A0A0A9GH13_ARUDO